MIPLLLQRETGSRRTRTGILAGAFLGALFFMMMPVSARAEIYDNLEPEIDFSDTSGDDELPEELRGKILTEDLQQALQEAMATDQTDPEAILDAQGLPDEITQQDDTAGQVLDPTDGSPLVLFGDTEAISVNKISLVEHPQLDVSYDAERKRFVYEFPNGADFSMTAPLGGIANGPVTLEAGEGMEYLGLWLDDESLLDQVKLDITDETEEETEADGSRPEGNDIVIDGDRVTISRPGDCQFIFFSDGVSNGAADDSFLLRGSVRILDSDEQLKIGYIGTPPGFTLSLISCNGEKQEVSSPYGVQIKRDGNYRLIYNLGKTEWSCSFRRDTTPPILLFSEPLEGSPFQHEITWQTYRPDTEVEVYWNNNLIDAPDSTVIVDGQYRIEATDAAGNLRQYRFAIAKGMKLHPEYLLPGLGVLILFSIGVVLVYRRRLTVL